MIQDPLRTSSRAEKLDPSDEGFDDNDKHLQRGGQPWYCGPVVSLFLAPRKVTSSIFTMASPNNNAQLRGPGRVWQRRSRSTLRNEAPLAEVSIAIDLEDEPDPDPENPIEEGDISENESCADPEASHGTTSDSVPTMVGAYRRTSFTSAGSRATIAPGPRDSAGTPTRSEKREARREERSLLRDNKVIPPKHPRGRDGLTEAGKQSCRHLSRRSVPSRDRKMGNDGSGIQRHPSLPETAPLLGDVDLPYGGQDTSEILDKKWVEAVIEGKIHATWQREAKVLARYSAPLILTFFLQYSLTVASIFTVGHLGKVELAAVSLASMTANITGYAIYQGLATSLDTLCAQAYGSGKKTLVGLQTQRMVYFLWSITIPIAIVWLCADIILTKIVPEKDVATLAGRYLKVILIGAPGYACFESIKRYTQAQGLFSASLYVLLICAPLNAFLNWLFVWV